MCVALHACVCRTVCVSAHGCGVWGVKVLANGGIPTSTISADFVELFNFGAAPVSLTGWSVQVSASEAGTGASWTVIPLGSVVIPAGAYFTVGLAVPANGKGAPLLPDLVVPTVALSGAAGKVRVSPPPPHTPRRLSHCTCPPP